MAAIDRINLHSDPRVEHRNGYLNGHMYHYMYGEPKNYKATILMVHGWPDISAGWRFQIPMLLNLGFRVIAPDLMGFGGTDAPRVPPNPINLYGCKRACDDFALLVKQLGCDRVIILGHDWGGIVAWRMAQWYPDLVTHVIVVCTSYATPQKEYISIEQLVASGRVPQFGYHLQLASPEVEHRIASAEDIRKFLHGMYGARGPNGETGFTVDKGLLFENLDKIGRTPLLTDSEMDYYVSQYSRNGLHGIANWYRTRKANWEDDLDLIKTGRTKVEQPTLFIQATRDSVFTPATMVKMGENIPKLTVKPVEANHWVLWEKPAECNAILEQWLKNNVLGSGSSL